VNLYFVLLSYILSPTCHFILPSGSSQIFYNPSLLKAHTSFSVLYANPFSIDGLNFYSLSLSFKNTGFGVQTVQFGDFYMTSLNACISSKVSKNLNAGTGFELLQLSSDEVSNRVRFFGGISTTLNGTLFGVSVFNIYSTSKEDPVEVSLQISKKFTDRFIAGVNFMFQEGMPFSSKAGILYRISEIFDLSGGYSTNPDEYFVCMGFSHLLKLTYTFNLHTFLGTTHVIELSYPG